MADQKITELTELLTPDAADLLAIVDDPGGSPETKKITVANLTSLVGGSLAELSDVDLTGQAQGDLLFNADGTEWQDTAGALQWDGSQLLINDYSLPAADGSADQVLTTDGLGNVTFETPGGSIPAGTFEGQLRLWDELVDQEWEGSIELAITESNAAGGSVSFFGNGGVTPVEFLRWSATDGGVVHIFEPTLRLQDSARIDLWPTGGGSRPFIRGLSGTPYLEFTAENASAMLDTGAVFRYPVSIASQISAPSSILGDTSRLWSYQFNAAASTVAMVMNEDLKSFPIGAPLEMSYTFHTPTGMTQPLDHTVRFNNATFASVTQMALADTSNTDTQGRWWFESLAVGDILLFSQGSDQNRYFHCEITSITDNTSWWLIGVTVLASGGTSPFVNADDVRIQVLKATLLTSAGDVSKVGTPVDNQVAVWTGDGTIEGEADLLFSAGVFSVDGSISALAAGGDSITTSHDGTDANIDCFQTVDLNVSGFTGAMNVDPRLDVRGEFRVFDDAGVDSAAFTHDGTDFSTAFIGTTDWNITALSGSIVIQDVGLVGPVIQDYGIKSESEVVSANAFTITYTEGPAFQIDLEAATAAVTGTISGGPVSGDYGQITVKVEQDSTTAQTLAWAGGTFRWAGGTAHPVTTTVGGFTLYTFETWDGGTTWHGAGADYS